MITGLSGGGRSQAADILEDLGWFVIDNLPPSLIPKVSELAQAPGSSISKVALVVGTGPYHDEVLPALETLRRHVMRLRILFLEASTDVLVRRYESSRRRHPLDDGDRGLADAIEAERDLLAAGKGPTPMWSLIRASSTSTSFAIGCSRCSVTTPPMRGCRRRSCRSATSTAYRWIPTW